MSRPSRFRFRFRFRFRTVPLALASLLALGALVSTPAAVQAATVGDIFVSPATGDQDQYLMMDTDATCPAGTQAVKARVLGPSIADDGQNIITAITNYSILSPNSSGGVGVAASVPLKDVFVNAGALPQAATYQLVVTCETFNEVTVYGEFVGTLNLSLTGGNPFNFTYAQPSSATATTTTVTTGPADPVASGTQTTLTATIAPAAAGTVQFKRNGTSFGGVIQVAGGSAQFTAALPAGSAEVTAAFTPSDTNAYQASTSAPVSYLVVPKPVLTGNPQAGAALTCNLTATGTTYGWLVGGKAAPGLTASTVTAAGGWVGKTVACTTTTTVGGRHLVQTSAPLTVKTGGKLTAAKVPTVTGTPKAGRVLSCKPGTWRPTATSYRYQWLRNGKVIKGGTKATYKLSKADRRTSVTCRVTAGVVGFASGVATSKPRKIG